MKVTIVSPSFNQASFVRRTLDSIQHQTHADIEHVIQDAGSTDGAQQILKEYSDSSDRVRLVIERDLGQADAINRGFVKATGEIVTWLNTDDYYPSRDVIDAVVRAFHKNPGADVVYGRGKFVSPKGAVLRDAFVHENPEQLREKFAWSVGILQPALFMRRHIMEQAGLLDLTYNCAFDYEYWCRLLAAGARFHFLDRVLAHATFHETAKSSALRLDQLIESALVTCQHYGYASHHWVERAAACEATGLNGIIDGKQAPETPSKTDVTAALSRGVFRRLNADNRARRAMLSAEPSTGASASRKTALEAGLMDTSKVFVTAFDEAYTEQGLTLISSLRRYESPSIPIFVYDIAMSSDLRAELGKMRNVFVMDLPDSVANSYPEYMQPKSYAYKCGVIRDAGRFLDDGANILWIDAGVAALESLESVFEIIEDEHIFFVDHDDKPNWPFFNGTFCHPEAAKSLNASVDELFGPHLCSCFVGYKKGGRFQQLIDEADRLGRVREILVWSKHPDEKREPNTLTARNVAANAAAREGLSVNEALDVLGYLGHRQDQTVYSMLAARFGAPVQSALRYCRSDDASSEASLLNWQSGSVAEGLKTTTTVPAHIIGAVTYHHRGTFVDNGALAKDSSNNRTLVILGNGPSMAGFDFARFENFDTIGMNAAYRYWDQIGWYPTYYICLDKVVGLSHKEEIARLIKERGQNGIELFVLRRNLLDEMDPEIADLDVIWDFDEFRNDLEAMDAMPITTGSHASLVGALLGYKRMVLMGIDCNYVEKVDGAVAREGTMLELTKTPDKNDNYFFEGYQVAGDKYNVPNPSPDLHLNSWRAVGETHEKRGVKVWNGSAISRVDAFVKRDFAEIEREEEEYLRERLAKHASTPLNIERPALPRPMAVSPADVKKMKDARRADPGLRREKHAQVDETAVVAKLFGDRKGRSHIMIDVGAHFGTSAAFFHKLGWTIHCFEPDSNNRKKLVERFDSAETISIDPRAVSDRPGRGAAFFTSGESTGISGLSAFRDTHEVTDHVDVTTVEEIVRDKNLTSIDFLKIDVEGFDFSVLKGVPWDRIRPDVIECEYEDAKTLPLGHSWSEIAQYLKDRGYAVYISEWHPIVRYGIPHDWRRVISFSSGADIPSNSWGNLLAFKDDPGITALQGAFSELIKYRTETSQAAMAKPATKIPTTTPTTKPTAARQKPAARQATAVTESRPFYAPLGERLRKSSPLLFTVARLAKRAAAALWRRRLLVIPAAALLAFIFFAGLSQSEFERRIVITGAAILAGLLLILLYLGWWTYHRIRALAMETTALRESVARKASENQKRYERTEAKIRNESRRLDLLTRERISRIDNEISKIDNEIARLSSQNNAVLAQHHAHAAMVEEINDVISEIDEGLESIESDLDTAQRGEARERRRAEALQAESREQAKIAEALTDERDALQRQVADLKERANQLAEELLGKSDAFETAASERETLKAQLTKIIEFKSQLAELSEMNEMAQRAEQKRQLSDNNLRALQKKYKTLAERTEAQTAQLEEAYAHIKAAREQLKSLEQKT